VVRLIERAKLAGRLRADVTPEDLPLLLMANAGVVEATGESAPAASRRFVALMLEAFRADGASALAPPIDPVTCIAHGAARDDGDEPRPRPDRLWLPWGCSRAGVLQPAACLLPKEGRTWTTVSSPT
jgi:hypothetical protein